MTGENTEREYKTFDQILYECKRSTLLGSDSLLRALEQLQTFLKSQDHKTLSGDKSILEGYANEIYSIEFVRTGVDSSLERNMQEMIDSCLDLCGVGNAFLAAVQIVRQSSSKGKRKSNIASLLSSLYYMKRVLFHNGSLSDLIHAQYDDSSSNHVQEESIKQLVPMIQLLPVQVANACHQVSLKLPEWAKRQTFMEKMIKGILTLDAEIRRPSPTTMKIHIITITPIPLFLDHFVEKMLLLNRQDEIATAFVALTSKGSDTDTCTFMGDVEESIVQCIGRITSDRQKSRLICSILKHAVKNLEILSMTADDEKNDFCEKHCMPILKHLCLSTLQSSKTIRDTFVNIMILSPGLTTDPIESCILVQCTVLLLSLCEESRESDDSSVSSSEVDIDFSRQDDEISTYSVLMSYLVDAAILWSGNQFISKTDRSQRLHISYFIKYSIRFIDKTNKTMIQQDALNELIPGISNRLSVSDQDIRIEGMQIAEKIAPLLGQTLKFEELDLIRGRDLIIDKESDEHPAPKKEKNTKLRSKHKRKEKPQQVEIDPDEEYQSQDEENSEKEEESYSDVDDNLSSDSDWDESNLPTYQIEDNEEDLNIIPRPYYLQQCIELLTSDGDGHEDVCKIKVALTEIPGLVRSQPPDLEDFAVALANELLHKENKYNMDDFEGLCCSGLTSLLVYAPVVTIGFVHRQLFSELCMDKRLTILTVMQASAAELSGEGKLAMIKEEQRAILSPDIVKVSGKRHLVINDNLGKTRRWGRGSKETNKYSIVNNFGPLASLFFYPMIDGFMKSKDNEVLWGGEHGGILLSRVLLTLSSFVEYSGTHPSTGILATDLFEFTWPLLQAENPEVRVSVLVAIASCFPQMPEEYIIRTVMSERRCLEILTRTATYDCDEKCRTIASSILNSVKSMITM